MKKKYFVLISIVWFCFSLIGGNWTLKAGYPNCTLDMQQKNGEDLDQIRECYFANFSTDNDEDGFYNSEITDVPVELTNCNYCPASSSELFDVRLIDELNVEPKTCEYFEYMPSSGFKYSHIRTVDQNNPDAPNWPKFSNPGKKETSSDYDDDCDGKVNEFTFQYYPFWWSGKGQTGQSQISLTLNINEPRIMVSATYNIVFDVFKIEQLPAVYLYGGLGGSYKPDSISYPNVTPIASNTVPYNGGTTLNATIYVPDNTDQVYVVKARLMTRGAIPQNVVGFNSSGNVVLSPLTVDLNNKLLSDNFYIMLSRYENGYPVSEKRTDIINTAFYYAFLSDEGLVGRQKNYSDFDQKGYYTQYETGTFFANHRQVPWCSEFLAGVYQTADETIKIYDPDYIYSNDPNNRQNADNMGRTDYISIGVRETVGGWFSKMKTDLNSPITQNIVAEKSHLIPVSSIDLSMEDSSVNNFVPAPIIKTKEAFSSNRLQAGDHIAVVELGHTAIFVGYTSDPRIIITAEGNQSSNRVVVKYRIRAATGNDRILNIGTLPY